MGVLKEKKSNRVGKKMDPAANKAAEIARALSVRNVVVDPCYVQTHCYDDIPMEVGSYVCAVFLDLTGNGAHFKTDSWAHYRNEKGTFGWMWFYLFLDCMRNGLRQGSVTPKSSRKGDPTVYRKTVELVAKQRENMLQKGELSVLLNLIECTTEYSPRFLRDVQKARKKLLEKASKEAPKKKTKAAPAPAPTRLPPVSFDWLNNIPKMDYRQGDASFLNEPIQQMLQEMRHRRPPPAEPTPEPTPPVEEDMDDDDDDDVDEGLVGKMSLTVVPIPLRGYTREDVEDDYKKCGGIMCFWAVNDPNLNCSTFLSEMANNLAKRKQAIARRINGSRGAAPDQLDMFPHLAALWNDDLHPAGRSDPMDSYFEMATQINKDLPRTHQMRLNMRTDDRSSPFHLCKLLTVERAVNEAINAGCNPDYLEGRWYDPASRRLGFPNGLAGYKYPKPRWADRENVGQQQERFPHVKGDRDFIRRFMDGQPVSALLNYAQKYANMIHPDVLRAHLPPAHLPPLPTDRLTDLLKNNVTVSQFALRSMTRLPYATYNEFMHAQADAKEWKMKVDRLRPPHAVETLREVQKLLFEDGLSLEDALRDNDDLGRRVLEYQMYADTLKAVQEVGRKKFESLYRLDGDTSQLNIPPPIRAMLDWFKAQRFPHLTCQYYYIDPEVGLFGNTVIFKLRGHASITQLLEPRLILMFNGLFSCYSGEQQLVFHLLAHGGAGAGKSVTFIEKPRLMLTIPGTIEEISAASQKADTSARHVYDEIILGDECPSYIVNPKEAEKNREAESREKLKMTRRQCGYRVLTHCNTPNGDTLRWTEDYKTDHYVSTLRITNEPVHSTDALSSRFHRIVVPRSLLSAHEYKDSSTAPPKAYDINFQLFNQITQFLVCAYYKSIMCGASREPYLDMSLNIMNAALQYLKRNGFVAQSVGDRMLDVSKKLLEEQVIEHANRCCYDMNGGENYKRKFDPSIVSNAQPYCYGTIEMAFFVMTLLDSSVIDTSSGTLLRNMCQCLGIRYKEEESCYFNYATNPDAPYRKTPNPKLLRHKDDPDYWLVDIQQFTYTGSTEGAAGIEKICSDLADKSSGLGKTEILGALKVLSEYYVKIPNYVEPQPEGKFRRWHAYTRLPDPDRVGEDGTPDKGEKNTGNDMPAEYMISNYDKSMMRTDRDVPNITSLKSVKAVTIDYAAGEIHFVPSAIKSFCRDVLFQSIIHACMTYKFPEGKMILGTVSDQDRSLLDVMHFTKDAIRAACIALDAANNLDLQGNWVRPADAPASLPTPVGNEVPPSRLLHGKRFNYRNVMSEADRQTFGHRLWVPREDGIDRDETTLDPNDEEMVENVAYVKVIADMDEEAAYQQHVFCGEDLTTPVRTPSFIRERFNRESGDPLGADQEYPASFYSQIRKRTAVFDAEATFGNAVKGASNALAALNKSNAWNSAPRPRSRRRPQ